MNLDATGTDALNRGLRRVQWSVLATLGVCALVALTQAGETDALTDRRFTAAALVLAAGSILTRRRTEKLRVHLALALTSLLLAGGVGLLGVGVALAGGDRQTALLYTLGGALLAARPPTPVAS